MAKLSDFDSYMASEADRYLQTINDKKGAATNKRQVGQRKRRLREQLYKLATITTGNLQFTSTPESMKQAGIEAAVAEANIENSIGQELEKYGSPPGGELVDDTNYEEEAQDEVLENYTLKPKNATIFGDKDGFGDWMINVYLEARPMLKKQVYFNYWKVKSGEIHFGSERSAASLAKALKWVSYTLRKRISANGITPNTTVISSTTTILNYDSGSHTLMKGRDN